MANGSAARNQNVGNCEEDGRSIRASFSAIIRPRHEALAQVARICFSDTNTHVRENVCIPATCANVSKPGLSDDKVTVPHSPLFPIPSHS